MGGSDIASSCSVLRSRRPQTRLEASCTRTGRPRRRLLPTRSRTAGEGLGRKARMNVPEESDSPIKRNVKRKTSPIGSIPTHSCLGIQPHSLSVYAYSESGLPQAELFVSSPRAKRRYASSPLWVSFRYRDGAHRF